MRKSSRSAANSAMKRTRQRSGGNPNTSRWLDGDHPTAKTLNRFERSVVGQGIGLTVALIGLGALLWTLWTIRDDISFREEERKNFRLDRIERAWSRITQKIGGNTGKGRALSYLLSEGEDLTGLDLSCATQHNVGEVAPCSNPPVINDIQIDGLRTGYAYKAKKWNVSGAIINNMEINDGFLDWNFTNTKIRRVRLKQTSLNFSGQRGVSLAGGTISGGSIALATDTKVSGLILNKVVFLLPKSKPNRKFKISGVIFPENSPPKCREIKGDNDFARYDDEGEVCDFIKTERVLICGAPPFLNTNVFLEKRLWDVKPNSSSEIHKRTHDPKEVVIDNFKLYNQKCKGAFGAQKFPYPFTYEEAKRRYPDIYK